MLSNKVEKKKKWNLKFKVWILSKLMYVNIYCVKNTLSSCWQDHSPWPKASHTGSSVDEWHSGVRSEDILMVISLYIYNAYYYMKQVWKYKKWAHFHHPTTRLISTRQVLTGDKSCEKLIHLFFALLKWVCHDSENFAKWRPFLHHRQASEGLNRRRWKKK